MMSKEQLKKVLEFLLKSSKLIALLSGWIIAAITFLLANLDTLPF